MRELALGVCYTRYIPALMFDVCNRDISLGGINNILDRWAFDIYDIYCLFLPDRTGSYRFVAQCQSLLN